MTHRTRIVGYVILGLLVLLFVSVAAGQFSARLDDLTDKANRNAEAARINEDAADANAANAERLRRQVERLGGDPVVGADEIEEPTGDAEPELTRTDVAAAVAAYCAAEGCDGQDGAPGRSVTPAQVAAAVATYCTVRGECRGAQGRQGDPGSPGAQGETGAQGNQGEQGAQGAQGPPPSNQQVADAVSAYCSDGRCRGPEGAQGERGPSGPAGADGQDGRGVQSITCDSATPFSMTITYSDGTTETVNCGGVTGP